MRARPASSSLRKWIAAGAGVGLLIGAGATGVSLRGGDGPMVAAYVTYFLGWPISLALWDSALSLPFPARHLQILTLNGALWAAVVAVLMQSIADLFRRDDGPPAV
jgi:hypothetical protein